jgi:hypothetical protein
MDSIYSLLENFFTISRVFGFYSRRYSKIEERFVTTKKDIFITIIGWMVLAALTIMTILILVTNESSNFFGVTLWKWLLIISYSSIVIQTLFHWSNLQEYEMMFNKLQKCDVNLRSMDIFINYGKLRKKVWWLLSMIFMVSIGYTIFLQTLMFFLNNYYDMEITDPYCIYLAYICFICAQTLIISIIVREQFRGLKSLLQ